MRVTCPTFITLGPSGTCHEAALRRYLEFQGIAYARIVLVEDLLGAIDQVREREDTFLVQCSAHLQVHLVTERYFREVFVVDTFIYPTKELALLVRTDARRPSSLGIVSATRGYTELERWQRIVDEPSKPVVARHLLAGSTTRGSPTCTTPANIPMSCGWRRATGRWTRRGWCTAGASASAAR